jgi:DNA-binding transcriptional regulator YhcF (GntR family)
MTTDKNWEAQLQEAVKEALKAGVTIEEMHRMLKVIDKEEQKKNQCR